MESSGSLYFLRLFSSENLQAVVASVAAVRNLSILPENQKRLLAEGYLEKLLELVNYPAGGNVDERLLEEIHCHSISTIRNIASTEESGEFIIANHGIEKMIQLLLVSTSIITIEVSNTLTTFSLNADLKKRMLELDTFAPLLKGVASQVYEVQGSCAAALGNLATLPESASQFTYHWNDVRGYLQQFIQSKDATFIRIALWTLNHLADYDEIRNLLESNDSLKLLDDIKQIASNNGMDEFKEHATSIQTKLNRS